MTQNRHDRGCGKGDDREADQGILLASIELPFDDPELEGKTVVTCSTTLRRYEGETLADPIEGVSYGRCKAKVMRGSEGYPSSTASLTVTPSISSSTTPPPSDRGSR